MKIEEIRGKGDQELDSTLDGLKKELFDLRFKSASQSLPTPSRIRALRRSIARMSTVIRERDLGLRGQKRR
ncbi:MAG: 50S ribosomal protein L29 [Planctomycetota bacterium]